MHITFDKIDGLIRIYCVSRYLTLFDSEKLDAIYNRIRYRISLTSDITYVFSHYYAKIKVDYYDSLTIEKRLTLHNVFMLIKLVLNSDKYNYYYDIFF